MFLKSKFPKRLGRNPGNHSVTTKLEKSSEYVFKISTFSKVVKFGAREIIHRLTIISSFCETPINSICNSGGNSYRIY